MKSVFFITYGCKVNQYDTQSIRQRFLSRGFREAKNLKDADICVINTCTVTHKADRDSLSAIRRAGQANSRIKVIATGCLVQDGAPVDGADLIIAKRFFADGIQGFSGRARAFVKIQDGCNYFCSYCKIPLVRGCSRSRTAEDILAEVKRLVASGYKEIVLCGICLGAWGRDFKPQVELVQLFQYLEQVPGLCRLRLSSIEARDVTPGFMRYLGRSAILCQHLHIPIQSGDDAVLRRMNRRYTRRDYLAGISRIKRSIPSVALTTDVMVGFPGETDSQFANTLKLVRRVAPLKVHIFPYSARPGTAAFKYPGSALAPNELKQRIAKLKVVAGVSAASVKRKWLNKTALVLVEARVKGCPDEWEGFTNQYIKVRFPAPPDLSNQLVPVKLIAITPEGMRGSLCYPVA